MLFNLLLTRQCAVVCFTRQENENLRGRVHQLETSLQQRAEQLSQLERKSEQREWRKGEELRKREDRVRDLELELNKEREKEPVVKVNHLNRLLMDSRGTRVCLYNHPKKL